jgi:TolB-like protein
MSLARPSAMSESSKAIFLSYASQDAEAARRICDALRAAGLEVWFDQSELRGGDAWDASIRRQIRECALFLPVISSTTNSRSEGYFRLEWKLAVERSHLMADDQPFLLPVAIDDTPDGGARVPDAFRARQWTRLPDGVASPAFCAQVKRLLDEAMAPETPPPPRKQPAAVQPAEAPSSAPREATRPAGRRSLATPVAAALALVAVLAGLFAWQPWKPGSPPSGAGSTAAPATTAASSETIAVLPFANLNPDKADPHFADGFSEEILNTLSRIPGLRVTARTASFSFKGKELTTGEIAAKLGVNYVVEGSVRRTGDQARVIVQLVKGSDGFQAWSETYTLEVKDIYTVQNEVAIQVARALKLRLGAAADEKLASGATQNPAAYDAYLRGQEALNRGSLTNDHLRDAARLLLQAVTLDPGFALAHGRLAEVYIALGNSRAEPREKAYPLAKASAERALAIDPRNVPALNALGEYAFHYAWEWEESDRFFRQALAIDPNYYPAVSHLASHDRARNRLEDSLASYRRVKELNPLANHSSIMYALINLKRYDEAIELGRQDIAASPASMAPRFAMAYAQNLSGQGEEGLRALEAAFTPERRANLRELVFLGWSYSVAGQKDKARAILRKVEGAGGDQRVSPYDLAYLHAGLGERDRVFELLERAYAQRDPNLPFIGSDPRSEPIRGDPRFRDLLKRMKLDVYFPEAPVR